MRTAGVVGRATLVLRFSCDMPVHNTARMLDCSVGIVKSRTARGLDTLRTRLPGPTA